MVSTWPCSRHQDPRGLRGRWLVTLPFSEVPEACRLAKQQEPVWRDTVATEDPVRGWSLGPVMWLMTSVT